MPQRISDLTAHSIVRWAVKSLYRDQALPRGPLVQWYLQLMLGFKLSHKDLRDIISETPGLRTEPAEAKKLNFTVVLDQCDHPCGFKGFLSEDNVAESLASSIWDEITEILSKGGWPKAEDQSHKYYVVASWLHDVSPLLRERSFGLVLNVVRHCAQGQNSINLLGHRCGLLVPYAQSEECERRINACTGQPTCVAPDEQYVKTWDELKWCLKQLLSSQKDDVIEVSKVKARFRANFQMELSETVFGYQCLSKMLADPQLTQEFDLETIQGNRYMLRLRGTSPKESAPKQKICIALAEAMIFEPDTDPYPG